jgi:hypothetical protein
VQSLFAHLSYTGRRWLKSCPIAEHIVDHEHQYIDEDYEHALKVHLPVMVAKIDCVIARRAQESNFHTPHQVLLMVSRAGVSRNGTVANMADCSRSKTRTRPS